MLKKIIFFAFFALVTSNAVFAQTAEICTAPINDTAVSNSTNETPKSVPAENVPNRAEREGELNQNYTIGERLGIGALNIFGGAGSIIRGERTGWLVPGIQGLGLLSILGGLFFVPPSDPSEAPPGTNVVNNEALRRALITAGCTALAAGVVVGFVIPFFHQNAGDTRAAQINFPFGLELVSSSGQNINGFRISYNMSF